VITVSLLTALLPRMSRAAAADDRTAVRDDLSFGLRISGVVIVPAAFAFLALGRQVAVLLFQHGATELGEAHGIGSMLTAFGLGLIPFSAQYVILRGFYAFGDTRTPFFISLVTGAANAATAVAASTLLAGTRWPVVAMAAGYGVSSAAGLAYAARRLRTHLSSAADRPGRTVKRTYRRLVLAGAVAAVVAFAIAQEATAAAGPALGGSLLAVTGGGAALVVVFVVMAKAMRVTELDAVAGAMRARLRR
jgi:putative peptidoglycan lipid II flippase